LQVINGVLVRRYVLGIPDLHRDLDAQREFVLAYPTLSVVSALTDLVQIVLTIVLGTIILRFFWRLVVADAKRLLDDPGYRPIVFLLGRWCNRHVEAPLRPACQAKAEAGGNRGIRAAAAGCGDRHRPAGRAVAEARRHSRLLSRRQVAGGRSRMGAESPAHCAGRRGLALGIVGIAA